MKVMLLTAALVLPAVPMLAQAGEQGVSHPDQAPITVSAPQDQAQSASASSPDEGVVTSVPSAITQDDASAYHPYHPGAGPYQSNLVSRPTSQPAADRADDVDADVVTSLPSRPGEVPEGTLLKARMNDSLSTKDTMRGSSFTATLTEDIQHDGRVIVPAGSVLDGMVTEIHGGRRISGRAAIHLEPRRVTLPDGTYYVLHAQVIDTSEENNVKVDGEGTILRKDHAKETLAIVTATTGSAAVAGAMIGGGVGAAVGAGIGAGASTILWLKQDRQAALPKNTTLVFSLTTPMLTHPLQDGAQLRP
ncbi:hypothetical protein [Granulicella arctica]|uniref:TrbI/VirB10 family protein n=1 Tax=Granulicella arctica TaxID=940613 RepID=A0A7Y9TH67_9BACT|nr:hypothetical protein [Granulicella arctica]NYF80726.1 hypothetical protein [Granulicella arctica]